MTIRTIRVLLIEDDPLDAESIARALRPPTNIPDTVFSQIHEPTLAASLACLKDHSPDAILLDLGLPDATHLDALDRIREFSGAPIVVLTGTADMAIATAAIRSGAQDYLVKGQFEKNLLSRALVYAIERKQLLDELEWHRAREAQEREICSWEELSANDETPATAATFGVLPLRNSAPDVFDGLKREYESLLELVLEHKAYQTSNSAKVVSRTLATMLGETKASPRDVVDLHSLAIKDKTDGCVPKKVQAYIEEGRYCLLELMGNLANYYRTYATGILSDDSEASA